MTDRDKVLETCDEIKALHARQVRFIEERNPANYAKIRAVTNQIRRAADRHMEAMYAMPAKRAAPGPQSSAGRRASQ